MRQIALIALLLALVGVSLAGLYFLGLAAVSFIAPASAQGFLLGFAGTASAPYLELTLQLAVGAAFVARAPLMMFPLTFGVFGCLDRHQRMPFGPPLALAPALRAASRSSRATLA